MSFPFALNLDIAESQKHNENPRGITPHEPSGSSTPRQDNPEKQSKLNKEALDTSGESPYSHHYQPTAAVWALYLKEREAKDKEFAELQRSRLGQLLVFGGIFGAILTAFLIISRQDLKADPLQEILQVVQPLHNESITSASNAFRPTKSALAVNATWYLSLVLTLVSTLAAVLADDWLTKYIQATHGVRSYDACERHLRYLKVNQWGLTTVIAGIPVLIQHALFLFGIGLVIFSLNDDFGIGIGVLIVVAFATILYHVATFLPRFFLACPFQTPLSDFIPGNCENPESSDSESQKRHTTTLLSLWNKFLREIRQKPKSSEIEAMVLAWIITKSTNEDAIEEAVKAIAGAGPTKRLQDALNSSGASEVLSKRFIRCFKFVPARPPMRINDPERAEAYLYAMWSIVGPPGGEDRDKLQFMLELLRPGQPLHQCDIFEDHLKPLASALRTRILIATGCDNDTILFQPSLQSHVTKVPEEKGYLSRVSEVIEEDDKPFGNLMKKA